MAGSLTIKVEFTGGLEMLFENKTQHTLSIPSKTERGEPVNIKYLVEYLCQHVMKDPRKDLFVLDGGVRPGILVLVNDADWELEGEDQYQLVEGDTILFVSTLHGG